MPKGHVRQQRGEHRSREFAAQAQADEKRMGRPIGQWIREQRSELWPHRRQHLHLRQRVRKVGEQRCAQLLQKALLVRTEVELLGERGGERGAARRRQTFQPATLQDARAREDASEERITLLGAVHGAVQRHRLLHHLEDVVELEHVLKGAQQLDERGAEALPRAVA